MSALTKDRHWLIKLNRLKIGHTRITHEFLMQRAEPTRCEDCDERLSVLHIITECPIYRRERSQHFGLRRLTLKDALGKHAGVRGPLQKFLRDTHLLDRI